MVKNRRWWSTVGAVPPKRRRGPSRLVITERCRMFGTLKISVPGSVSSQRMKGKVFG